MHQTVAGMCCGGINDRRGGGYLERLKFDALLAAAVYVLVVNVAGVVGCCARFLVGRRNDCATPKKGWVLRVTGCKIAILNVGGDRLSCVRMAHVRIN